VASQTKYVLDANVLIEAKRRYYRFGLCPGFWDCLSWHYKQGTVRSIDRVKKELDIGKDELTRWAKKGAPAGFFAATTDKATAGVYGEMVAWAHAQPHFLPPALTEFAMAPDGWLVAYAKANGLVLVTHEVFSDARNEVKIPNVCKAFDVAYVDTFDMLEDLKTVFTWKGKP
jgi:hypothetical protein